MTTTEMGAKLSAKRISQTPSWYAGWIGQFIEAKELDESGTLALDMYLGAILTSDG